jgi:hypothetical protein
LTGGEKERSDFFLVLFEPERGEGQKTTPEQRHIRKARHDSAEGKGRRLSDNMMADWGVGKDWG